MTVNLKTIPTPTIGSDAHSVSSLAQMLATITSNFNELKTAYDTISSTLASQPTEYLADTVPDQASVGDKWYKTDNPTLSLAESIEAYVCREAYTAGDGLNETQKLSRWKPARDKSSQDTIATLTTLLDGKASMYQSDDPPASMDAGDIWIDINVVSGINQAYVAINDYDYSGSGGTPVAGWTDTEIGNHFRISGDKSAQAAAADADGIARSKTVNYLRSAMPGISAGDITAELEIEIGDSWTEDVAPFQSYVCYSGYLYSEIPADAGDRATFLAAHWKAKGDKVAQDAATAASALADSKISNFRQLTVPDSADILDTWFKNFAGQDRDELYVCNAAYAAQDTADNFATAGYASVELYRLSFWDRNLNKDALDAADSAANIATGKTTDWYLNDPPSAAGAADRWMDRDASPVGQYAILAAYDYSAKTSVTWVTTGTTDDSGDNVTLVISDFWAKVSQEDEISSLTDLADKANAYIDGSRVNYMGISPPQSSGISYTAGGSVTNRPIGVGDTWVKVDLELTSVVDGILSTWVCIREYQSIAGLTFDGYTAPDRDGSNNLLNPGDAGFNTMNAYNYWAKTQDPVATEAALDIIALKDGKRETYITDSRDAVNGIPNVTAALGGIQLGDIWIDEGNSFNVYKCKQAYSSDEGTFQGVVIPLYEDLATNWLLVSEPELQAQAILRRSLIDGKRKTFVSSTVPNPGGGAPANWDNITGAELGDIWIDTSTTPATKYWCSTAYTSGGTQGTNWTNNDQVGTPATGFEIANKDYVDTAITNLIAAAPGALDTLNELAAALGDDPNFATTVTNSIATAQNTANTAVSNAATAQSTANTAVSNAATAQSTADNASTLLTGILDASPTTAQVLYVGVSATGNGSGDDASNRMAGTGLMAVIEDTSNLAVFLEAGSYGAILGDITNRNLFFIVEGAVSIAGSTTILGGSLKLYSTVSGNSGSFTFGTLNSSLKGLIYRSIETVVVDSVSCYGYTGVVTCTTCGCSFQSAILLTHLTVTGYMGLAEFSNISLTGSFSADQVEIYLSSFLYVVGTATCITSGNIYSNGYSNLGSSWVGVTPTLSKGGQIYTPLGP